MKKRSLAAPFLFTALALADAAPPKEKLPKAPESARVRRDPDGTCWLQTDNSGCPPGYHCNPPPPRQVECPPPEKKKK